MRSLLPRFGVLDTRSAQPAPKTADPELLTPEHKSFRLAVLERAGYRCEWIEKGKRCIRSVPAHKMIADHKRERRDGGAFYDPANGQCLCVPHNTLKGIQARARRQGAAIPAG